MSMSKQSKVGFAKCQSLHRWSDGRLVLGIGAALLLAAGSAPAAEIGPVSVGAGVRTSFNVMDVDGASEKPADFTLDNVRLYLSGTITDTISLVVNGENSAGGSFQVMDAFANFAFSEKLNFWVGRHLPPGDRSNLYGPYYANHWNVYKDGVQDGWPFNVSGRNDGITYWGQFGAVKVSFGASDVSGATTGDADVIWAGRVMVDFWDAEAGYFLNSTYYGDKDLLAVGIAAQKMGADSGYSADFLLEKKLGNAGVVTIESEYTKYDGWGGYLYDGSGYNGGGTESDGFYVLGSYLFPQMVGPGKIQILGKYSSVDHEFGPASTVEDEGKEINIGYIIKAFNARAYLFYLDKTFDSPVFDDFKTYGLGLQLQM